MGSQFRSSSRIFVWLFAILLTYVEVAGNDSEGGSEELRTVLTEEVVTIQSVSRSWKDENRAQVAEGVLQQVARGVLTIEGTDGAITTVDIDTLCKADQSLVNKVTSMKDPIIYFPVGKQGLMRISYGWPQVFVLQNTEKYFLQFLHISYREGGETQTLMGGFLKIDGELAKVAVESLDNEVLKIEQRERVNETVYDFFFLKGGSVVVKVTIGDRFVWIPIVVTELPVTQGAPVEDVIEELGLPEKKEVFYCKWPEKKSIDSIFYSAEPGKGIIAAQHWQLEKYPHCRLSMVDGKVYNVGLDRFVLTVNMLDFGAWSNGKLDKIVKDARRKLPQNAGTKLVGPPAERKEHDFRTWTDSTGKHTTEAKFIKFEKSKVYLEKPDGSTISLSMNDLSREDQEYIREELKRKGARKNPAGPKPSGVETRRVPSGSFRFGQVDGGRFFEHF